MNEGGVLSEMQELNVPKIKELVDAHFHQFDEEYLAFWTRRVLGTSNYSYHDHTLMIVILVDTNESLDSLSASEDLEEELSREIGTRIRVDFISHKNYVQFIDSALDSDPIAVGNPEEYGKFMEHLTKWKGPTYRR